MWPAIVLLIVSSGLEVAWGARDVEVAVDDDASDENPKPGDGRRYFESRLKAMSVGSLQERLEAVEDADELLEPEDEEDPANPTPEEIGAALVALLESEPDEWVRWNLLDALEYDSGPPVNDLFRAALLSPSANLRAKALTFYEYDDADPEAVPLLEGLWETGVPSWALPELMAALANQGSQVHARDFLLKLEDPDRPVRLAAIKALAEMHDDDAFPRIVALARAGDSFTRRAALDALGEWPDSEPAMEALVQAVRSHSEWRRHALRSLLKSDGETREETLLDVLADPETPDLWAEAAPAIESSTDPNANAAIVAALVAAAGRNDKETTRELIVLLNNRDDIEALPFLAHVDPDIGGSGLFTVRRLVNYLERDRSDRSGLRFGYGRVQPPEPEAGQRHVVARGQATTVRCWEGPEIAFESWLDDRIPDGTPVTISDFFDRSGETWVQLEGNGMTGCWIPLLQTAEGVASTAHPPDPRRRELDLPAGAVKTAAAKALIESEVIEIFDEDPDAVAVAVHIRPGGPSLSQVIEQLRKATRHGLEDQMDDVATRLEEQATAATGKPIHGCFLSD